MSPEPAPIVPIRQEPRPVSQETLQKLILEQDLAKLTKPQQLEYVLGMYDRLGLDPVAGGLQLISLQGKLKLYAGKELSAQLSSKHGVRCEIMDQKTEGDMRVVTVRAIARDGRASDDIGVVSIKGLAGETLGNAMMKAVTKAKRRATLSCLGLGMLDESEVDSIPGAKRAPMPRLTTEEQPEEPSDSIPIDPPRSQPPDDDGKPKKWVAPAKGWWDEPFSEGGGHSWKTMAEHYPGMLVEIVVAAGKRCGKRPTEEDWNGWTEREISALRSLERFNIKPLEEARAKAKATQQQSHPEHWTEDDTPAPAPDAPVETNDPASWQVEWFKCWCGFGPDPEARWDQVVNEQAAFVRDHLKKLKVQQPDMKQWAVRDAKLLTAVRLFNATLLQK